MQKITVVENEEFTKAYNRVPTEQRARVAVVNSSGERLVGESEGGKGDLSASKTRCADRGEISRAHRRFSG